MIYSQNQLSVFILSIIFGIFLSLLYELFSSFGLLLNVRKAVRSNKKIVYVCSTKAEKLLLGMWDLFYCILISPSAAIFLYIANFGALRWYIAVGVIIGFVISKLTFCKIIGYFLKSIVIMVRKYLFARISNLAKKTFCKMRRIKIKRGKSLKKERVRNTVFGINVKQG